MSLVIRQNQGQCAVLTLNRPDVLNAISDTLLDEFDTHLDQIASDNTCRAIVITGNGRAFCAGSDLSGKHAADPEIRIRRMHALIERLQTYPKITVAALNGITLGGGLELALACTFRIGHPATSLGLPEVKLGLIPLYGGTLLLPRLIGESRALEMMISGDPINGEEGLRNGLLNHLSESAETLLQTAIDFAQRCSRHSLVPQQALRRLLHEAEGLSLQQGMELEWQIGKSVAASADAQEGIQAFIDKRKPVFRDR